jgi:NTP pyrophosphatase (non-canonical NTP hydrolase)
VGAHPRAIAGHSHRHWHGSPLGGMVVIMSYSDVQMKIIQWSEARKIIPHSTPQAQLLKAVEELGELAAATMRGNRPNMEDAVGDVMVCLVNYCALSDIDLVECMKGAYEEIKDRKGTMSPNGIFIKE